MKSKIVNQNWSEDMERLRRLLDAGFMVVGLITVNGKVLSKRLSKNEGHYEVFGSIPAESWESEIESRVRSKIKFLDHAPASLTFEKRKYSSGLEKHSEKPIRPAFGKKVFWDDIGAGSVGGVVGMSIHIVIEKSSQAGFIHHIYKSWRDREQPISIGLNHPSREAAKIVCEAFDFDSINSITERSKV